MRYHDITKADMLNGDGLRVVLWLSGCSHCCKGCQNPLTWDPEGGLLFDDAAREEPVKQEDQVAKEERQKEDKEQRAIEFIDECPKKKKKEGDLVLWQE